mmetsp:Transcript_8958/g.26878  ORF Transcript_8958/g.26878 Transcript_8958/m.26878 type:complete len:163 (+) Transcript_8958:154-642(+)
MCDFIETELDETLVAARALVEAGGDAAAKLDEADELIQQLQIDARGAGPRRKELEAKLKVARSESDALRARGALLTGAKERVAAGPNRLEGVRAKQEQQNETIETTRRVIEEIEETGKDIIDELGRNKETMVHINQNISSTKGDLKKAEKITTRMGKWWSRW